MKQFFPAPIFQLVYFKPLCLVNFKTLCLVNFKTLCLVSFKTLCLVNFKTLCLVSFKTLCLVNFKTLCLAKIFCFCIRKLLSFQGLFFKKRPNQPHCFQNNVLKGFRERDQSLKEEKYFSWICERGLRRVALQFPDSLLSLAPAVAARIHVSNYQFGMLRSDLF